MHKWWPPGHIIGYEHTFVHTIADFVSAFVAGLEGRAPSRLKKSWTPQGASLHPTFEDALRTQRVLDAVARSAKLRSWSTL